MIQLAMKYLNRCSIAALIITVCVLLGVIAVNAMDVSCTAIRG